MPGPRHSGGLLIPVDPQPWPNPTELLLFDIFLVNSLGIPKNGEKSKVVKRKENSS